MEGIDQKRVVTSTESSEVGKTVVGAVPKPGQPLSQMEERSSGDGPMVSHPDPTRFGDWERAGRCIDF